MRWHVQMTDLKTAMRELKLQSEQSAQTTDLLQMRVDESQFAISPFPFPRALSLLTSSFALSAQ